MLNKFNPDEYLKNTSTFNPDEYLKETSSFDPDEYLKSDQQGEGGVLKALGHGFSQSTLGLGARALSGGKAFDQQTKDYDPKGVLENIASLAGEYAPDLALAPVGLGVANLMGRKALQLGAREVLEKAGTRFSKDYLKQKLKIGALEGLGTEVITSGTKEPLKANVAPKEGREYEGNILGNIAKNVAIGAGLGAVAEPLLSVGLEPIRKKLASMATKPKDTELVDKVFTESEAMAKEAGEISKIHNTAIDWAKERQNISTKIINDINKRLPSIDKRMEDLKLKTYTKESSIDDERIMADLKAEKAEQALFKSNKKVEEDILKYIEENGYSSLNKSPYKNIITPELQNSIKSFIKIQGSDIPEDVYNLAKKDLDDKLLSSIRDNIDKVKTKDIKIKEQNIIDKVSTIYKNNDDKIKQTQKEINQTMSNLFKEKSVYEKINQFYNPETMSIDSSLLNKKFINEIRKVEPNLAKQLTEFKRKEVLTKADLRKASIKNTFLMESPEANRLNQMLEINPEQVADESSMLVSQIAPRYTRNLQPIKRVLKTEEDVAKLSNEIARDKLNKLGITSIEDKAKKDGFLYKFLNMTERFDKIERNTGVKTGTLINSFIEHRNNGDSFLAKKLKDNEDIIKLIESDTKKDNFYTKLAMGEVEPKSEQEVIIRDRIRNFFDSTRQWGNDNGADIKYIQNYIPVMKKIDVKPEESAGIKMPLKERKLSAEHERQEFPADFWTNNIYEKDLATLMKKYATQVSTAPLYKKTLPQYLQAVTRLKAMGHKDYADLLTKNFEIGTGAGAGSAKEIFATEVNKLNEKQLDNFLALIDKNKKDMARSTYNEILKSMYHSWIGLNPKTLGSQRLQNQLVLGAEVGNKYVAKAEKAFLKKEYKDLVHSRDVKDKLLNDSTDYLESTDTFSNEFDRNTLLGKLKNIVDLPAKPGMAIFKKTDDNNRYRAFLAGYLQMKEQGFKPSVISHLLESQQRAVREAYAKGGLEQAAKEYGVITSHRSQYLYEAVDKPEIFQEGLGKFVPFTTWGRNQWARFYGDLANQDIHAKGIKTLAKRILYPTAFLSTFSMLTGYEIPNANPLGGLTYLGNLNALPSALQPIESLSQGNYGKAGKQILQATPLTNLVYKGLIKEGTGDPVQDILGLKPKE